MDNKFWKSKKILITGGAGFIGSALVKALVTNGANVKVVDNLWRGNLKNLKNLNEEYVINIEEDFYLIDLIDYKKCLEIIREVDFVYHLADVVAGVDYVFSNESFVFRQNVLINSNTLSACITNNIQNFIYIGTACSFPKHLQMADSISKLREDQTYPAEPESSYGWSKLMGEYEASLAEKYSKLNVGLLRLHNVYGPGSVFDKKRSQVLPSLVRKAVLYPKENFIVWGSGKQYRDFIYIDDAVDALLLVAQKGMRKGLIQIGSEQAITIKKAAETIVEISGKDIKIQYDIKKPEGDKGRVAICERAREILGWRTKTNFKNGIKNLYNWVNKELKRK